MEILDGLSSVTFTSKADLTTATAEYLNCQQQKPTQTPHYSTILQEISQLTGGTLIALNHFLHRRGSILVLLE